MSQIVLYCLHSTSVVSFYIDKVLTLSMGRPRPIFHVSMIYLVIPAERKFPSPARVNLIFISLCNSMWFYMNMMCISSGVWYVACLHLTMDIHPWFICVMTHWLFYHAIYEGVGDMECNFLLGCNNNPESRLMPVGIVKPVFLSMISVIIILM